MGIDFVYEPVGQCEVGNGVFVLSAVVIVAVTAEGLAQSVVVVEHGGYAVEAEAVEVKLFEPVLAVGEQEVYHFVFAVIEAERVPRGVFAPVVAVEELVGAPGRNGPTLRFRFSPRGSVRCP